MHTLPPHLNPEVFSEIANIPPEAVAGITGQLSELQDSYTRVAKAKADIMADTSKTEDGRLLALDELFTKNVISKVASVRAEAEKTIHSRAIVEAKRDTVFAPSANAGEIAVASEIRASLARLSPEQRTEALRAAIEAGDRRILSAVVSAPAFLSGVDTESQAAYGDLFISLHHPELKALCEAAETATRRSTHVLSELEKIRIGMFSRDEEARLQGIHARHSRASRHLN